MSHKCDFAVVREQDPLSAAQYLQASMGTRHVPTKQLIQLDGNAMMI